MLKLGLFICALSYVLCYYINDIGLRQDVYFIGHALGLLAISYSWEGGYIWKNILTGFSFGRLFDEIIYFVMDYEETPLTYSLVFIVVFPAIGWLWRNYKHETKLGIWLMLVGSFLKELFEKIMHVIF